MEFNVYNDDLNIVLEKNPTIHSFFEKAAKLYPDKIAVISEKGIITYSELNKKANRLARVLIKKDIKNDNVVGIQIPRSIEMLVAILAIMKAGAAYLPIEMLTPSDRISYMLNISQAKLVLYMNTGNTYPVTSINMDDDTTDMDDSDPGVEVGETNLAYIIFTSGSTGNPKGVMIEHGSVINRLIWMWQEYDVTKNDIIMQKTPYTFDVSVWEIFLWFFAGASVYLYKQGEESNVALITEKICENKITICHFIPSILAALLHYVVDKQKVADIDSLRHIFCSGEVLNFETAEKFNKLLYAVNGTHLNNLYGPTEATVDVTYFDCTDYDNKSRIIPIGKPISNTQIFIKDETGIDCSDGEIGELYIAGKNVGRGYINRTELTAERFITDKKLQTRMFRTGDLARWSNGYVEFVGRSDNQIKIRGMRVEPEEIEAVMMNSRLLRKALVGAISNGDQLNENNTSLIALYEADKTIDEKALYGYMSTYLPEHMIPSKFIFMKEIKTLNNGKIDRRTINEQLKERNDSSQEVHLSKKEESVLSVIRKCLNSNIAAGLDKHLDDKLSVAGIDSITYLSVIVELENRFNITFDNAMLSYTAQKNVQDIVNYVIEHADEKMFTDIKY